MLVSVFALIITISIASALTIKFKYKQESSIAIVFLSIALFLYISGLFNLMKYAMYIIYLLTLISFIFIIYSIIKRKIKITDLLTINTIIYTIIILLTGFIVRNTYYVEWDEFSHWGANLKAMVQYDLFWSNDIYDGVHVVYTPIAGLVEYFFCKLNGGFAEDVSYIAINSFIITLILPVLKSLKYGIKNILKCILFWIAIYCAMLLFNFKICSIYTDFLLGVLFAVGMFLAYRLEGKEDKINLLLILISLPLLKDTGLLLLGIILVELFLKHIVLEIIYNKKITKKEWRTFGTLILILVIVFVFYGSWKIYCSVNNRFLDDRHDKNAISEIHIKEYIKALMLKPTINPKYTDISRTFYTELNSMPVAGNQNPTISALKVLILLDILGIILYNLFDDKKQKNKILTLWITFNIGFVLYCLLLLATFMFAFTEQEGRSLASYSRYMSTYFVGWLIASIGCIGQLKGKNNLIMSILIVFLLIYPMNFLSYINFRDRKGVSSIPNEIKLEANIIKEKVDLNDKVYLIYQNIGGGIEYHMLRYSISPIVTNLMYEWSLGPKYYDTDIWSYDITKEEFVKKLTDEEFDYVFIAKIDEQFINMYGELIEGDYNIHNMDLLNNKVLKINRISENKISLSVIE